MALPKWTERLTPEARAAGVDLTSTGFADAAWPIERAGSVIEALRGSDAAVLGGDILRGTRDDLEHTFDSWSCEMKRGEPWAEFVSRSYADAIGYLSGMQGDPDAWFTLEISPKPAAKR